MQNGQTSEKSKTEVARRVSFLGSPAALLLERASCLIGLCQGMAEAEGDPAEKSAWSRFAQDVAIAARNIRDQGLEAFREADSGIKVASRIIP